MQILLLDYIKKGGFLSFFNIMNKDMLLQKFTPSWIDKFKKFSTFCFNTNIGILELSFGKYEQIEVDDDTINEEKILTFKYDKNQLNIKFYLEEFKSMISTVKEEEDYTLIILENGVKLGFNQNGYLVLLSKDLSKYK